MQKLSPWVLMGLTAIAPVALVALVAPVFAQSAGINLATPQFGQVTLANGNMRRGRISVDNQGQRVVIANGDSQESISFRNMGTITYAQGAVAYRSNGDFVVRGDGSNIRAVPTSLDVGWQDFATTDEALGQVQVVLPRTLENEGIIAVAQDTQYVVDEIVFDPVLQRMVIRATAY